MIIMGHSLTHCAYEKQIRRKRAHHLAIPTCGSKQDWKLNWHKKTSKGKTSFGGGDTDYFQLPNVRALT